MSKLILAQRVFDFLDRRLDAFASNLPEFCLCGIKLGKVCCSCVLGVVVMFRVFS